MADVPDYYEILQVHPKASPLMIKKAYRTLLMAGGHPDLGGSQTETRLLTEAYEVLADPDRRMAYDRGRLTGKPSPTTIIVSICPHCGVYNRVRSETKLLVARCGKCGQPIGRLKPPAPARATPWWRRKWPWIAVPAVAVMLGAAGYLGVSLWNENRDPMQEAADLEDRGQLAQAADRLTSVVASDPRNPAAHQRLGRVLEAERRIDAAISEYQKAVMLDPQSAKANYLLGQALMRADRSGEAEPYLRKAVELDGADVGAMLTLAGQLSRSGRVDEAIALYRRALPLDGKDAGLYARLASAYRQKGDASQAINLYRQALAFDSRQRDALVGLGTLYSERKAYAEALGEFQQAALIQNDDPELHLRMGELYRETSDLANAERELRLSQSQARGNPALLDRIQQTLQGLQAPRSTP